jgi:hypothetical protein
MSKNKQELKIDIEVLSEKVYRLMLNDIKLNQSRQGKHSSPKKHSKR